MSDRPGESDPLAFGMYVTRPGDWFVTDDGRCFELAPGSLIQMAHGTQPLLPDGQHVRPLGEPLHPTIHNVPNSTN